MFKVVIVTLMAVDVSIHFELEKSREKNEAHEPECRHVC